MKLAEETTEAIKHNILYKAFLPFGCYGFGKTTMEEIATGMRLAVNDAASTKALLGLVQDLDTSVRLLFLGASRRFGDNWVLTAELRAFINQPMEDLLFDLRDDEIIQIELAYYF